MSDAPAQDYSLVNLKEEVLETLAAGAIHPKSRFDYAFKGRADFICVGMFDFGVAEDAQIASDRVEKYQQRARPWQA